MLFLHFIPLCYGLLQRGLQKISTMASSCFVHKKIISWFVLEWGCVSVQSMPPFSYLLISIDIYCYIWYSSLYMAKDNLHTEFMGKVVAKTCRACHTVLMPEDLKDNRRKLCMSCDAGREFLQEMHDNPEIYGEGY